MSAELVLAIVGLIEGSIKLVRKVKATCDTYRAADEEINERYNRLESVWIKTETQLKFLRKISDHLTDELVESQLDLLRRLKGKLVQAVSRLEDVSPENAASKGKAIDMLRKWKFAIIKNSLDELIAELDAWQQLFDPTWYLMILITDKVLDNALLEWTDGGLPLSSQGPNALSKMLAIRSTLKPAGGEQDNIHVSLGHNGLKGAKETVISMTTARAVLRAGSSELLIVESITCAPGTAPQVKDDVKNLAKKLRNVDPETFGLLSCKGILKHHDSAKKLSAIEFVYRTPRRSKLPETLRQHLSRQNPVSLSTIIRIAKQLVRSVHYVHTCGFVHKNIRPENIILFPSIEGSSLGQSFLIGFTDFRNANFQTNLYGDAAWHRNLYRHPQRQGAFVPERYIMQHDIYSLGVCLLEIGLWQSFVWYPAQNDTTTPVPSITLGFTCSDKDFEAVRPTGQEAIKEKLVELAKEKLPPRVGDAYTDIVVACMTCLDPENGTFRAKEGLTDEDGITIGVSRASLFRTGKNPGDEFYQRGLCRNGDNCPYRHQEADHGNDDPGAKPIVKSSAEYTQPAEEKATRTISGALVHFNAGAAVVKVVFTSDLSAVQLTGLARDTTRETVLNLLRSRGVDTTKVNPIRVVHGEPYSSARVEAEDHRFAELVVAKLGGRVASQQGAGVRAIPITPETFSTSDSSALRVDCKKVHCSWHKPSKTVWLNFGSDTIAKRACERFEKGEYKILDQMVHAADPQRGAGRFNPKAWTVCLTDVPSDATEANISRAIRSIGDKPRGIELGTPTYSTDAETCASQIQSLFTAVGPLEWWEFTPDATGKRMKASARFSREEDAKEAVTTFHNSPLPFLKTAKLTVQLVYCARFKVSSLIYDAVERQIKANIPRWKAQYLHFTAYEQPQPPKWYRTLKIEGENSKNVADAKNTISSILTGTVAKNGSSVLWQSSLRSNGETSRQLAQLQQRTSVVILRNKAKSQIRLFGPPNKCEEVQTAISKILNDQRSKDFAIELDEEKFLWARLGGYKQLAVELGADSVSLDVTSTPKRIIVTGTVNKYDAALSIINGKVVQSAKLDADGQDCSACWTEAENPIRTRSGKEFGSRDSMCWRLRPLRHSFRSSAVTGAPLVECV
ncbi:hypothetical protein O1611_g8923 [Lasiodiplodia mahajangana]|uniref:Uncharacterized protein n=1 Tax=Lasiodiplodia mahajangana TaxID=1108764 RepID=A0ACC2JB27_9PEZI|nr:hypothetical protein O1611_g8923 [Lasiodiplodia mahajangana]